MQEITLLSGKFKHCCGFDVATKTQFKPMTHPAISLLTNTLENYYLQHGAMPACVILHPANLVAIAEIMGKPVQLQNNNWVLQVNSNVMLLADDNCLKAQMKPVQQEAS
jgi:hypothetical protein